MLNIKLINNADNFNCKVVAVDQDPTAYEKALQLSQLKPYKNRLFPILGRFGTIHKSIEKEFKEWQ